VVKNRKNDGRLFFMNGKIVVEQLR